MFVQQKLSFKVTSKGTRRVKDVVPGPINKLPNELLCIIFANVARLEPPQWTMCSSALLVEKAGRNKTLGFLRLSEVCWRFRAVLLSMPAVWATALRLPAEPGQLALTRSRSEPLTMYIRGSHDVDVGSDDEEWDEMLMDELCTEDRRFIELAIEHASRIRSLTMRDIEADDLEQLFEHPLPVLQDINFLYSAEMEEFVEFEHVYVDAPNLLQARFMFLQEGTFPFILYGDELAATFRLPALRKLEIFLIDLEFNSTLKLGWIVDVLQNSPLIEDLKIVLGNLHGVVDWDPIFDNRNVQLQHLKSLELEGSSRASLGGFYNRVCVPSLPPPSRCIMRLTVWRRRSDILKIADVFGSLVKASQHDGLLVRARPSRTNCTLELASFPKLRNLSQYSSRFLDNTPNIFYLSVSSSDPRGKDMRACSDTMHTLIRHVRDCQTKQLILDAPDLRNWPNLLRYMTASCKATHELLVQYPWNISKPRSPLTRLKEELPILQTLYVRPVFLMAGGSDVLSWWAELIVWLKSRVRRRRRVQYLHILQPEYRLGASSDGGQNKDRQMRKIAARLVDKIYDERKPRPKATPEHLEAAMSLLAIERDDDVQSSS